MPPLFQVDLAFLFEQPSIWRSLVQSLILMTPLTIAVSGYATWRIGDQRGALLMLGVALYSVWMLWPFRLPAEVVLPARVGSVIGWLWLVSAWGRQAKWHEPFLLAVNGLVLTVLLALSLTTAVALIRDALRWDKADAQIFGHTPVLERGLGDGPPAKAA